MVIRYGDVVISQPEVMYFSIPLILILFVILRRRFIKEDQRLKNIPGRKRTIFFMKTIFFILLLFALSAPGIEKTEVSGNLTKITALIDRSESMGLYDIEDLEYTLDSIAEDKITIDKEYLELADQSAIGNALLNKMSPDENILLVTDGQNNYGAVLADVALFASSINTRLYGVELKEKGEDARVMIEGPTKVVSGVENTFSVKVGQVGYVSGIDIRVYLDDSLIYEGGYEEDIELKKTFYSGTHILKAEIDSSEKDMFPENDFYIKIISVYDKPEILFVSEKVSPMAELYSAFYELDERDDLDTDLDKYYAVVLNDINAEDLSDDDIDALEDYVLEGNGLFVIGGKNSYDWGGYNASLVTNMLPVSIGKAKKKNDITNIVILMDTGASGSDILVGDITHFDIQKSLAADIVKTVPDTNKVAIYEANYYLNRITGLSDIGDKRPKVVADISLLTPHGFSELRYAYSDASESLRLSKGSKNIVIITDGKITPFDQEATLERVMQAHDNGIKTFIIGVGDSADEEFLQKVKTLGGGEYFRTYEKDRIKLYFGNQGDIPPDKMDIFVYDSNHFITEDLDDLGRLYGYNNVYPKSNARMLLSSNNGDPILTIWNFGLGRVAALSTDDGSLWVPDLMDSDSSRVLIKSLNWLIENPERKDSIVIDIPDMRVKENSVITVRSEEMPADTGLKFYEYDTGIFKANIYPEETGLIDIMGMPAAVNYKKEYLNLGISQDLARILNITGGRMLPGEKQDFTDSLTNISDVEITRKTDLSWIFVSASILVYLIELVMRRMFEMRMNR